MRVRGCGFNILNLTVCRAKLPKLHVLEFFAVKINFSLKRLRA